MPFSPIGAGTIPQAFGALLFLSGGVRHGRISGVSGHLRGARVTAQAPRSRKFTLTKDGADVVGSSGTLARGASTVKGAGSRRAGGWEAASGAGCPTCGRKATWS